MRMSTIPPPEKRTPAQTGPDVSNHSNRKGERTMGMELIRRSANLPALPRSAAQQVMAAQVDGLVAAERIFAARFVTEQALYHTGDLRTLEAHLMERARFGEADYGDFIDTFKNVARTEIAYLGMRSR